MSRTIRTRAMVCNSDLERVVSLKSLDILPPAPGEVLLKTEMVGVCGSDLHVYDGWYKRGVVVPGHEMVGRIAEINGEVRDSLGRPLSVGDRVVPESQIPCRRCRFCRGVGSRPAKIVDYSACESYSIFGLVPVGDPPRVSGGWSEYVQVPANAILHRIDPTLPLEAVVLLEPFSVATKAVARANVAIGDSVVIQGPGPVGLLALVAARAAGAGQIILVGPNEARLQAGTMLGADAVINTRAQDPVEAVKELTDGRMANRVIEASGAIAAFQQGLEMAGRNAIYVLLGDFRRTDTLTFFPNRLMREKIDILLSHLGSGYYEQALSIVESRRFPLEKLVTHHFPFEQVEQAMETLEKREGNPIKIALTYDESA